MSDNIKGQAVVYLGGVEIVFKDFDNIEIDERYYQLSFKDREVLVPIESTIIKYTEE